jgi:hypothetical protein
MTEAATSNALPEVKRIPMGVRALPVVQKSVEVVRVAAEGCGGGVRAPRRLRLDELDGDAFK